MITNNLLNLKGIAGKSFVEVKNPAYKAGL